MSSKLARSIWVVICIAANLLSSEIVLADSAASAPASTSESVAPVAPADPVKLVKQAEELLDTEDLPAAINLYMQAAEMNYTPAQAVLGDFLVSGEFYETAVGWYLMAAMQGNAAGQYGLAQMYNMGKGIDKDLMKALYWYRRSAAQDNVDAIKIIAAAYSAGGFDGLVQPDQKQAKSWYNKAARLEDIARKVEAEKMAARIAAYKKRKEEAIKAKEKAAK
jgi:uncharacterized protein